jgi:acetyltransferase-like isoleucine patch superfamily enzyme
MKDLDRLLKITKGKYPTCSLLSPKDRSVTFIKSAKHVNLLPNLKNFKDMVLLAPCGVDINPDVDAQVLKTYNVDLLFTLYHNLVYEDFDPMPLDYIDPTASVHHTAVIGVDGIKVSLDGDKKILFKHIGNVVIEADADIGANAVIHRARLDSTVIGKGTVIGALTNIGHNVIIGKNCVFATNISVGGSTIFGDNCWVGMGAMIKNGLNICNDVVIGMGAVVLEDIDVSGIYIGNPAKYKKDFNPGERGF